MNAENGDNFKAAPLLASLDNKGIRRCGSHVVKEVQFLVNPLMNGGLIALGNDDVAKALQQHGKNTKEAWLLYQRDIYATFLPLHDTETTTICERLLQGRGKY